MNKPPSLLSLVLFLVVLAVFGVIGAKYMLGSHSESTMSQLALVWPGIETMPEPERGFLVELALTCNAAAHPAVRAEVLACLRSATGKLPPGSAERLDRLLGQAPATTQR